MELTRAGARAALPALLLIATGAALADEPPRTEPIDVGLREEAVVRRLFFDVEVRDARGEPMTGLSRSDFKIRLDYVWRAIDTVDDLCACGPGPPSDSPAAALRLEQVRTRYVLYFDFAQLRPDGRLAAIARARDWVRAVMLPGDEVMVAAHATATGLVELSPFSADGARALAAIERAEKDPDLVDPFPGELLERLQQCQSGTLVCANLARADYRQMKRSLNSLIAFLTRIDRLPGRKALFLFHQNMVQFPDRPYDDPSRAYVPDVVDLTGEAAAAATSARASVYPVPCGAVGEWSRNFGANLADATGGSAEPGAPVEAGRRCPCFYRIGLVPPDEEESRVHRIKVKVRGRSLPGLYHTHALTALDRWSRMATSVLTNPADDWGLKPKAHLRAFRDEGGKCALEASVAIDLATVGREWEVGGVLADSRSGRSWEMLGLARLPPDPATPAPRVVHRRTLERLPPGSYELRAFVHDRASDAYGGDRVALDLTASCAGGEVPSLEGARLGTLPLRIGPDTLELVRW